MFVCWKGKNDYETSFYSLTLDHSSLVLHHKFCEEHNGSSCVLMKGISCCVIFKNVQVYNVAKVQDLEHFWKTKGDWENCVRWSERTW
jgi:hypothetical protein